MAYEKRVCVLKQVRKGFTADGGDLTGAVYAERLGETLTVTPRILGIAPVREGRFALVVWVGGTTYCLELTGGSAIRAEKAPPLKEGFAALLVFLRGEAEPVAFGTVGNAPKSYSTLLAAVDGEKRPIPNPLPPYEVPFPSTPNAPRAPGVPMPGPEPAPPEEDEQRPFRQGSEKYDDEAIAAGDYFRSAKNMENAQADACGEEQGEENPLDRNFAADEAPLFPRGTLTYYNTVRERLETALQKFPPDERLKGVFPLSEWVQAESGALLGVIYENGAPRYLCVAVEKAGDAPAEMEGRACFVPLPFSEEGFWVVFQDADTGEYATVSNS